MSGRSVGVEGLPWAARETVSEEVIRTHWPQGHWSRAFQAEQRASANVLWRAQTWGSKRDRRKPLRLEQTDPE